MVGDIVIVYQIFQSEIDRLSTDMEMTKNRKPKKMFQRMQ